MAPEPERASPPGPESRVRALQGPDHQMGCQHSGLEPQVWQALVLPEQLQTDRLPEQGQGRA